jgi:D-glycero-D-manno-heptose 1,7-bisphosphate phosphatase
MGIGRDPALTRAVFFDRDGVLNEAVVKNGHPFPPASVDELRIDDAAASSIARLRERGFAIVVVTNQPDVARGATSRDAVEAINTRLADELAVDAIYTCYHDNADACACRKPKPGLLLAAARDHGIELRSSYMVGDRWSDVAAGREARCRTVWIERGYDEKEPLGADARVASLASACDWIVNDDSRT